LSLKPPGYTLFLPAGETARVVRLVINRLVEETVLGFVLGANNRHAQVSLFLGEISVGIDSNSFTALVVASLESRARNFLGFSSHRVISFFLVLVTLFRSDFMSFFQLSHCVIHRSLLNSVVLDLFNFFFFLSVLLA